MGSIKVVLLGVGNATSVFLQGLYYYKNSDDDDYSGIWHPVVGNYKISDIEVIGAFDIDSKKIGLDLADAIYKNKTTKYLDIEKTGIDVEAGILNDELPSHLKSIINVSSSNYDYVLNSFKELKPDIVINLISSGLDNTSKLYAECSLEANADFINATPTNLTKSELAYRYDKEGILLIGDDLMSQFGGTAFHKGIVNFMVERGIVIEKSYQLDVGGNMDTLNTMEERIKRLKSKVKTDAINIEAPYEFESIAGTTEYTEFLDDGRISYYWLRSKGFINTPITVDIVLRTNDGANAANVLLDVIRATKYSKINNINGKDIISSYGFKNAPKIKRIRDAYKEFTEMFVNI
ncbi:MAG: inositol-3-phosphate synthase [Candidatus Nitrosocaldaceae archaeon]|nr:MAG: inositol-3-phosphate synthase [Candidatus Nitrosocaldaceae archaeon]